MLRLQLSCAGERVWISCSASDKVQHVLDLAGKRWEKVLGARAGQALWVKYDGAKLHGEDVLGTFVGDKDTLEVGFDHTATAPAAAAAAAGPAPVTGETVAHDMEQLEKALQELFEGGPLKTVSELEEFRGLPEQSGGNADEDEDEADDDEHAVCLAVAMYNFVPEEEDEIGFRIGDELIVYRKREDGWWRGRQMRPGNNPVGYFPGNRVKEIDAEEAKKTKGKEEEGPAAAVAAPAAAAAAKELRRSGKHSVATMECEEIAVKVESAPGHGSPEMLRAAVLESEETRVEVWRATMDTETVHVDRNEADMPIAKAKKEEEEALVRISGPFFERGNEQERHTQPALPRRSVSMDSKALGEAARLVDQGDYAGADKVSSSSPFFFLFSSSSFCCTGAVRGSGSVSACERQRRSTLLCAGRSAGEAEADARGAA